MTAVNVSTHAVVKHAGSVFFSKPPVGQYGGPSQGARSWLWNVPEKLSFSVGTGCIYEVVSRGVVPEADGREAMLCNSHQQ